MELLKLETRILEIYTKNPDLQTISASEHYFNPIELRKAKIVFLSAIELMKRSHT